jgi:dCMP deaminase
MSDYERPSWDEYFINIMVEVGKRSTCDRGRSGAVVVRDNHILASGYAASPIGLPHCDDLGHEMIKMIKEDGTTTEHCVRTNHAEENAICQASKLGIALDKGTFYARMTPCYRCAKMIINSGIERVIALNDYQSSDQSKFIFEQAGVKFDIIEKTIVDY